MTSTTRGALVTLLALASWSLAAPAPAAQASSVLDHGPILVEGDSDLCNEADLQDGKDVADGIINCSTADGSPERPYVIGPWRIRVEPMAHCRVNPQAACNPVPPCSLTPVPAALAVCGTRKHVRIEDVSVVQREIARSAAPGLSGVQTEVAASAIALINVDNLQMRRIDASSGGMAIFVDDGKPVPTLAAPRGTVLIEDVVLDSPDESGGDISSESSISSKIRLLQIDNMNVTLRRAHIEGNLRDTGVAVSRPADGAAFTVFELLDSTINSTELTGLQIGGVRARLEGNRFVDNGRPGYVNPSVQTAGGTISINTPGAYLIQRNRFIIDGYGIVLLGGTGRIAENDFSTPMQEGDAYALQPLAFFQESQSCSPVDIHYNNLAGTRAANFNQNAQCAVDARFNWWGDASGPSEGQTENRVNVDGSLQHPLEELSRLVVASPANENAVHGKFLIVGSLQGSESHAVRRIEATKVEAEWTDNQSIEAAPTWALPWDASTENPGPFSLWLRACGNGADCGIPSRIDLNVVERPLPPVAILQAHPRTARVAEPISLDASLSYSPQDRPILSYRFDPGTGNFSAWAAESSHVVQYASPGEYVVSVQVLDADELINENFAPLVVRVLGQDEGPGVAGESPGTGTGVAMLLLVVISFAKLRFGGKLR